MKTRIRKTEEAVIVSMDGHLDFETAEPLKHDLEHLINQLETDSIPKKIIFDLEQLEFVGSSGISNFIQALKAFNERAPERPSYQNVGSEFQRVIRAFDDEQIFNFEETDKPPKEPLTN